MKVTINDVAEFAGVSIKTVSRVINNEPSVRQATKDKVQQAITALNYQPSSSARNLAGTKSYTIGFIYDNPNAYYVIDMQNGILSECLKRGYELLIHPCDSKSEDINEQITNFIQQSKIAGLILAPPLSETPAIIYALKKRDVNFIRIVSGSVPQDDLPTCIVVDDFHAAESITQHLIDLKHTQIGFLCGDEVHKSSHERLQGYKASLEKNHIAINNQFIVDGQYSFESGVKGAQKLLALANPPTAIFACNDEIAAGALFAARLKGVDIPKQLSIVGFEDSPFSRQTWPTLTTAQQPTKTIATNAAALLIESISATRKNYSNHADKETIQSQFEPKLIIRDSTGSIS